MNKYLELQITYYKTYLDLGTINNNLDLIYV